MRHLKVGRKFNMNGSHRVAMLRNMIITLFNYNLIKTTLPKAKTLRTIVEPLINLGKRECILRKNINLLNSSDNNNSIISNKIVNLRRKAFNYLHNKQAVSRLFEVISPNCLSRNGGYIKLLKCGYRFGDKAPMAFVMITDCYNYNNAQSVKKLNKI